MNPHPDPHPHFFDADPQHWPEVGTKSVIAISLHNVFWVFITLQHWGEKLSPYSDLFGLIKIVIASHSYRSSLTGIVIASFSYCSKVTKPLSLLIIMLLTRFTLITPGGFSPSGVMLTRHACLGARIWGRWSLNRYSDCYITFLRYCIMLQHCG